MAQSPLLGGDRAPQHPKGTSTEALGPSDLSDSGSDITGAVGAVDTDREGFDGGTNDDVRRAPGAGADIGDANLDADSDSGGSGERAEAGRDTLRREAPDIAPDQVQSLGMGSDDNGVAGGEEADDLMADDAGTEDGEDDDRATSPRGPLVRKAGERWNTDRPAARGEPREDPVSDRDKSIDA